MQPRGVGPEDTLLRASSDNLAEFRQAVVCDRADQVGARGDSLDVHGLVVVDLAVFVEDAVELQLVFV